MTTAEIGRMAWSPVRESIAGVALALVLTGCSRVDPQPPPTPTAATASAPARPADPQASSAASRSTTASGVASVLQRDAARIIDLKNILQADPFRGSARLELGEALLEMSSPRAAETELAKALELGIDPNQVVPLLAKARVVTGQHRKALDAFEKTVLSQPAAMASLKATLAEAYSRQGQAARARELIREALALAPGHPAARVMEAKVHLADRRPDDALRTLQQAIEVDARYWEAWELKGDVLALIKRDAAAAAVAYEQAVAANPRYVAARAKLVMLAIDERNPSLAETRLRDLRTLAPDIPPTLYLGTRQALLKGDVVAARALVQRALALYPRDLRHLILGAEVELQAGALSAAEEHLSSALTIAPQAERVRQLLARTHLRSGASEKAMAALEPLMKAPKPDAVTLGLAAEAALLAGQMAQARSLFDRAVAADPDNPRLRTGRAIQRVTQGDVVAGLQDLDNIAATDKGAVADLALITTLVRKGDLDQAGRAAQRLVSKLPEMPLAQMVAGQVQVRRGDAAQARKHFETAAVLDPAAVPPVLALAELDLAKRDLARAKSRLQSILERTPGHLEASIALSIIQRTEGSDPAIVAQGLKALVARHAGKAKAHLALINHLLLSGQINDALIAAQAAVAQLPGDLNVSDALGRAQFAAGESAQALTTFRGIAAAQPRSTEPLLRMADVHAAREEVESAIEQYRKALTLQPNLIDAQIRLAGLLTVKKAWKDAMQVAQTVQRQRPSDHRGYHLAGLVLAAQQQWEPALTAFRSALARQKSAETAIQFHRTLLLAGRAAEGQQFAATWISQHPRDLQFIGHAGERALLQGQFAAAEDHFRTIVKQEPKNARALNLLAVAINGQSKPGALEFARRAIEIEPTRMEYVDAYAVALALDQQIDEAISLLKRAIGLAPNLQNLKFTLARLALERKDYPLARAHLDALAALGSGFPAQAAVLELRKKLP